MYVYVSLATLAYLNGERLPPWMRQAAYILLDSWCDAACVYCWLPRNRGDRARLARVTWYPVRVERLASRLSGYARVCIQGVERPGADERLVQLVKLIRSAGYHGGISVAHVTHKLHIYEELYSLGVDYVGVGLDVASERLRLAYGKSLSLDEYMHLASKLVDLYGRGRVYVHVIVGLGEYADELAALMERAYAIGARVALFAYTPAGRGPTSPPSLCYYRGAQLYRQLLEEGRRPEDYLEPVPGREAWRLVRTPPVGVLKRSMVTSGCPACNRPFYNESPRGPAYNVPSAALVSEKMMEEALKCFSSSRETATSP